VKKLIRNLHIVLRALWATPRVARLACRASIWGSAPLEAVPGGSQELDRIADWILRPMKLTDEQKRLARELYEKRQH
jgi:hypothetical protein